MTSFKTTLAAAALLSTLTASQVFAQAAIQEPGLFAFNYPNRDVLNGGAPTPAARLSRDPVAAANSPFTASPEKSGRHAWRLNH
jgi:hypothetical protein